MLMFFNLGGGVLENSILISFCSDWQKFQSKFLKQEISLFCKWSPDVSSSGLLWKLRNHDRPRFLMYVPGPTFLSCCFTVLTLLFHFVVRVDSSGKLQLGCAPHGQHKGSKMSVLACCKGTLHKSQHALASFGKKFFSCQSLASRAAGKYLYSW